MLKGIPLKDTKVTCEVAQKVNHDIVNGKHPEDGNLEAAVITHTLLCNVCNEIFSRESQESKDAKLKK